MVKTQNLLQQWKPIWRMTKISIETKRFSLREKCPILSLSTMQPQLNSLVQMIKRRQKLEINLELYKLRLIHRGKHIEKVPLHSQENLTKLLKWTLLHQRRTSTSRQVHSKLMQKNSLQLRKLKQRVKVASSKEMQLLSWTLSNQLQVVDQSISTRMLQLKNLIKLRAIQSLMQSVWKSTSAKWKEIQTSKRI